MNNDQEVIREYSHGDEQDIIKLHKDTFNSNHDTDRWRWQFVEGHSRGHSWISLAQSGNEIVGQYCMMRHHLNFNGGEIVAGQSCDTMVRSDQRGKRWFLKLAEANYEIARKDGAQGVFGFPNRNSYPGFMRHLSWVRMFRLNYFYYRLSYRKFGKHLDDIIGLLVKMKCTIERQACMLRDISVCEMVTTETVPSDADDICREINKYEVLAIWKDHDYLKWRYENHPQNIYLFHVLRVKDKIECIIVTRANDNEVHICEILSRAKKSQQALALLYHVMFYAIKIHADKVDFHGYDNGFYNSLFNQAKFKTAISNFTFCGRSFVEDEFKIMFMMPNNWTISGGDIDVI